MRDTGTYRGEQAQVEKRQMYLVDPKAAEQHSQLGIPYEPTTQDEQLTNFMNSLANPNEITITIRMMMRLQSFNEKNEMKEYLTWVEELSGIDKDGTTITVNSLEMGVTNQFTNIEYYKGNPVPKQYHKKRVYLQEFSKEKVEELINKSARPEAIQFTVKGSKLWSGFNKDEFTQCSLKELDNRGRLGCSGLYSHLQQVQPPPQKYQVITQK